MGRLIDADELLKAMDTWDKFGNVPNAGLIPFRTLAVQDIYVPYVKYGDMLRAVNGMSTVEAIPKDQYEQLFKNGFLKDCEVCEEHFKDIYEQRLKADLEAMFTELQLEIEEIEIDVPFGFEPVSKTSAFYEGVSASSRLIQQKINALKTESEDKNA